MAEMMRRLCAVVVVLFALQACSAQNLVNFVQPMTGEGGPAPPFASPWKVFDEKRNTYQALPDQNATYHFDYFLPMTPIRYRITMGAHVDPADYPTSWTVAGKFWNVKPSDNRHRTDDYHIRVGNYNYYILDDVSGAMFNGRVYEGILQDPKLLHELIVSFPEVGYEIAEVEILGPQEDLNALWPYGDYPCSKRLAQITRKQGPQRLFSQGSKEPMTTWDMRRVFSATTMKAAKPKFVGLEPIMIGAKSDELVNTKEVLIQAEGLQWGTNWNFGVEKVILQGNLCEGGICPKYGGTGWKKLAVAKPIKQVGWPESARISLESPGAYKAFRLFFYPKDARVVPTRINVGGIYFLGCKA